MCVERLICRQIHGRTSGDLCPTACRCEPTVKSVVAPGRRGKIAVGFTIGDGLTGRAD